MKVLHLSDLHICSSKDAIIYGINPYHNLLRAIERIGEIPNIDLGIISGDISNDGSESSYLIADEALSRLKFPIWIVNGNHDNNDTLESIARRLHKIRHERHLSMEGIDFLFLNTVWLSNDGTNNSRGMLKSEDVNEIKRKMCNRKILVMHHPAMETGSWLDRRILQNRDVLKEIVRCDGSIMAVLSGHNHYSATGYIGQCLFSTAPSISTTYGKDLKPYEEAFMPGFDILSISSSSVSKETIMI